jgi:hypothetical protein
MTVFLGRINLSVCGAVQERASRRDGTRLLVAFWPVSTLQAFLKILRGPKRVYDFSLGGLRRRNLRRHIGRLINHRRLEFNLNLVTILLYALLVKCLEFDLGVLLLKATGHYWRFGLETALNDLDVV